MLKVFITFLFKKFTNLLSIKDSFNDMLWWLLLPEDDFKNLQF